MALLQQTTAAVRMFFLGPGLAGVASTISKNGGAFAAAAGGAPVAVGAIGWYLQALTAADTNTLGDLAYAFAAGVGAPAQQPADQVANWFTTTRVNADVKTWLTVAPAALSAGGFVQSDVVRWNATAVAAVTAGGYIQADVARWLAATPAALDASGLVQVDTVRAVNVALAAPTVGGYLQADVALWKTATPAALDASGYMQSDVVQWVASAVLPTTASGLIQGDLQRWRTDVPAVLDATGYVQVDVVQWQAVNVFPTTASGLIQADMMRWRTSVPAVLNASGLVQIDVVQWQTTAVLPLTGGGLVQADLMAWRTSAPATLDGSGFVKANTQATAAMLVFDQVGNVAGSVGSVTAAVTLPVNPPAGFLVTASYGTAPAWYAAPSATVTLAAVQPLYAPAIAGDEMDLVDAPNPFALAEFAAALLDLVNGVETDYTVRQALRLILSSQCGKSSLSGTTRTLRDVNDTVNRIVSTTDTSGQRISVTLNDT